MDKKTKNSFLSTNSFLLKNRIAITTGEAKGIGSYIAQKSLTILGPQKNIQFLVWSHSKSPRLKIKNFKIKSFTCLETSLQQPFTENHILEIRTSQNPLENLQQAGSLCLSKKTSALITGPVSKDIFKGHGFVGQTDFLKSQCKLQDVFMLFLGQHFNVALLNDHVCFKKTALSKNKLQSLVSLLLKFRPLLKSQKRNLPVGLLGLNPHSGEQGLLGLEEEQILKPFVKKASLKKQVVGPLVPDAAFLEKNWKKYSFYLALYHDQGLIPFKIIHKHEGFALSLGLPFLRLGVDHGIGLDLKKSEIKHDSFLAALKESLRIIKKR